MNNSLKNNIWRVAYASSVKWLPRSCYSKASKHLRVLFARKVLKKCGKNVNIERAATFSADCILGDNSDIGYKCEVHGPVIIGNDVLMGPEVVVYTVNHKTESTDAPIRLQGNDDPKPVVIGDGCWLGHRSMIMPGVEIGPHSIVAAGAVVTKSFPPYSVIGGVPARLIKIRKRCEE